MREGLESLTGAQAPIVDPFQHEMRFFLQRQQLVALLAAAAPHTVREIHDPARPVSYTRTTYLDTDALDYLGSTSLSVSRRLRVREYANAAGVSDPAVLTGRCFLELKETTDTSRSKVRVEAHPSDIKAVIEASGIRDAEWPPVIRGAPRLLEEFCRARVRPRLTTWYRRICLLGREHPVRLTIDEDLAFCLPQGLGHAGEVVAPHDIIALGPARIVELKWIGDHPAWLVRAIASLEVRPREHSKFRLGMESLQALRAGQTGSGNGEEITAAGGV